MTGLRVLMVEDSEDDAILVQEALRSGGYDLRPLRVETADALRKALRDGSWDIVLSDYCLPSFNARDALGILKESGLDIPVIVISGTVGEDIAVETLKLGAEDYLLKQNLTRLVPSVVRALETAESRRQRRRVERMKTLILDNSLDFICTLDTQGRFLEVSSASGAMLGYEPAELIGVHFDKLVHPEELASITAELEAVLLGRRIRDLDCRFVHKSGRTVYLTWSAVLSKADGVIVSVGRDVTERKKSEKNLQRFRAAMDASGDAIVLVDSARLLNLDVNQTMCDLIGYSREEILAMTPMALFGADREALEREYAAIVADNNAPASRTEGSYRRKDGVVVPVETRRSALHTEDGWVIVSTARDITDRRQAEQRIRYLATHDGLTDLPNRNLIQDRIVQAITHARRSGRRLALLYLDLDRFKVINDGYGHPFGDAVLKAVGERLLALVREGDTVARQGGDEFLILLADLRVAADAYIVAQKIVESLDSPVIVQDREIHISGSIGVAVFPQDGQTAEALIRNADVAMYRAKDLGRNTYQFFTREMSEETQHRVDLETRLRGAAAAGQLELAYQPKVDLESGRITGCEALLRWYHPELGVIPPSRFIPIAEDSGLIVPIGDWVLRAACSQARAWMDAGLPPVSVAVNVSSRQFLQHDVVTWVMRILQETGLPPELLELELTESLIAQDVDKVITTFSRLQAIGVKLSIDDFGTGYSNLGYLKRFPVDTLKIDQSFVRDMLNDPEDATIVLAVISLAHNLGFKVIAEGVETEQHCQFLRQNRCDEIQGYYFSKPVPAEEFEAMLRDGRALLKAAGSL